MNKILDRAKFPNSCETIAFRKLKNAAYTTLAKIGARLMKFDVLIPFDVSYGQILDRAEFPNSFETIAF